jgi:hypothetical protein
VLKNSIYQLLTFKNNIMETINKNYSKIKEKIKVLSKEQRVLKNQRKTIHLIGERTMEPWQAYFRHQSNRSELRELYIAYGIIKGRNTEELIAQYKTSINMDKVNKLVIEYSEIKQFGSDGKAIHSGE